MQAGSAVTLDGASHVSKWGPAPGTANNWFDNNTGGSGSGPVVGSSISSRTTLNFTSATSEFLTLNNGGTANASWGSILTDSSNWTIHFVGVYTGTHAFAGSVSSDAAFFEDVGFPPSMGVLIGTDGSGQSGAVFNNSTLATVTGFSSAPHRFRAKLATGSALSFCVDNTGAVSVSASQSSFSSFEAFVGRAFGSSIYLDGSLGEVLMYNRATTSGEDSAIDTYLKATWGL